MALELTIRPKEVLDRMQGSESSNEIPQINVEDALPKELPSEAPAQKPMSAIERVESETKLDAEQSLGWFLRENPVNTALDYTERQARLAFADKDPNFNPLENIPAGYDGFEYKFSDAESKQEVDLIKDRLDREIANQYYAEKHPYIAMAMGMAGAVISPEAALPVGVGVKGIFAAKTFGATLATMANVSATSAITTFGVESLLRTTQPLRSEQERNEAVVFSAALSSALTGLGAGAAKLLKNKGAKEIIENAVDYDVSHAQPVKPMEMNLPDDFSPDFPTKFEDRADSPVPQMKELSQAIDNVEVPSRLDIYDDAKYTFDLVQGATQKNIPVAEALAQESPTIKAMARLLHNDDNFTVRATPEEIDVRMKRYVEEAKKAGAKTEAAGLETPPQKIINKILQELGSDVRAPRSAYGAVDSVSSEIQDIIRMQAKQKALQSMASMDGGQKVGLSAQAIGEVDSRLVNEKRVRLLSNVQGKIAGALNGYTGEKFRRVSANILGALSDSPTMRRTTSMLVDNGLKYNDAIATRGGQLPAIVAASKRYTIAAKTMVDVKNKMYKEFLEEAKKKGVTKDLKKTFNSEMARAYRTKESNYQSVTKRVKQLRDIEDEAVINEAVELKIISSKDAAYARAHLSRSYDRDFIKKNQISVEKQIADIFKETINDPTHKNYEFVKAGLDEIREVTLKDYNPKTAGISVEDAVNENADIWFAKLAKDTVEKMMGRVEFVDKTGTLRLSSFANIRQHRALAIDDEVLMKMGVLNDADPFASRLRNMRVLSNELEIYKRFQTLDFMEVWKPIKAELDSMMARGERRWDGKPITIDDINENEAVLDYLWRQVTDQFTYTSRAGINESAAVFLRISNPITGMQQLSDAPTRNLPELVTMGFKNPKNFAKATIDVALQAMTKEGRKSLRGNKRLGMAADMALWTTQYIEPDAAVGAGAKYARLQTGVAKVSAFHRQYMDLSNPYEVVMGNISAQIARFEIDDIAARLAKGVRKEKDIAKLADINLTEADALRIHAMINKHKINHSKYEAYNETKWEDGDIAKKYTDALYMFRELVKNKGNIDVPPMFADNPIGQLTMRFSGATSSFYQRTVIRGFQEGMGTGGAVLLGSILAGGLITVMRNEADGKESTPEEVLMKALQVGGGLGLVADVANKAQFAVNTMLGFDIDLAQGFAGSHYSGLENNILALTGLGTAAVGARPSSRQIGSIINAVPLNNGIQARSLFNELEDLLRTGYGYSDKYGSPFEDRSKLENEVRTLDASNKQRKKTKAKKTEEEKAEDAENKRKKKEIKQRLIRSGELK